MKKGIVFDFDYTLGDSTEGIVLSVNDALEQLGYERKSVEEIKQTVGLSLEKTYQVLTRKNNSEEAAQFSSLFRKKADEVMVANTCLYDGILEILKKLKKDGLQIGIVTTKFHYRIEQILEKFHAEDLIDFIIGAEDVQKAKPSPEGLLHMVKRMGLNPEDILYVGDSVVDAKTAERAGISFAGVLTGTTTRRDFSTYHCAMIGESMQEIYVYMSNCRF